MKDWWIIVTYKMSQNITVYEIAQVQEIISNISDGIRDRILFMYYVQFCVYCDFLNIFCTIHFTKL